MELLALGVGICVIVSGIFNVSVRVRVSTCQCSCFIVITIDVVFVVVVVITIFSNVGSIIYGRVMVDPQQSLGSAYHVSIEKVFVCSGLDDYIPQYSPENNEYGCLADSSQLSYRFKILVSSSLKFKYSA